MDCESAINIYIVKNKDLVLSHCIQNCCEQVANAVSKPVLIIGFV